ncbi:forkhead box protein N3 isoform X2 [Myotis myotis]|uniref:forkhead box protein N3 isoform X2 n=1 Tax=Myotis myotis TaxID=51298 RepID=UPI00174E9D3C|nr:forkhead box protein N3 isoform X2 [Myotis myotis]
MPRGAAGDESMRPSPAAFPAATWERLGKGPIAVRGEQAELVPAGPHPAPQAARGPAHVFPLSRSLRPLRSVPPLRSPPSPRFPSSCLVMCRLFLFAVETISRRSTRPGPTRRGGGEREAGRGGESGGAGGRTRCAPAGRRRSHAAPRPPRPCRPHPRPPPAARCPGLAAPRPRVLSRATKRCPLGARESLSAPAKGQRRPRAPAPRSGQSIGKGSLWCIDPEYRQNLIQALKKTPYHPHPHVFNTPPASPQAYQSTSGPPIWPGSTFFKRNGALLQDPDIDAASAMMLLNTPPEIQAVPPGVIQNGARVLSRGLFPGVRPLPITPIGMTAAMRNGLGSGRTRTESEPSCGSPVVSGDPKEDHNYSSAKAAAARSASPASDSVSSSSAEDHEEFATKGSQEGSEGSVPSRESHSEAEEDERKHGPREAPGDAAPHKKRQHLAKARRVPSDTLPLKKRRTEKPPESDDEEMKEAAGSLLHLAGIRSCLNNITNRTAKGQKEQKETTKN